jgi:cell division protein FtsB
MMRAIAFVLCFMVVPAWAQQSQTPSQTAIQIDNVINQWAQQLEALQRENADLKKQIEDAKAVKVEPDKK